MLWNGEWMMLWHDGWMVLCYGLMDDNKFATNVASIGMTHMCIFLWYGTQEYVVFVDCDHKYTRLS